MEKTIEEDLFRQFRECLLRIQRLARDPWIMAKTKLNLTRLELDLDEAWAVFQLCERTDNGPTPADIAGEVQHDIG